MAETPRLDLPYIAASQHQKEVSHNISLDRLDLLVQCAVLDRNLTAPPASPAEGDAYIVGPAPTDAWADHANDLALWISSQWQLIAPQPGWRCFVIDEDVLVYWSGTTWTIASAGSGSATTLLGLTDVPDSYSGQAGKTLVVNPGETAVEFGTLAGSAPVDAPYVVTATHAGLSAERVVTDTTQIAWDTATAGQLKATIAPAGVSLDKLAHQPQGTLLGRGDTLSPTDEVQPLTVGPGLTLSGTTLSATGSATDFLALTDTPDAYSGQAGKAVIVNPGATALEFGTAGAGDFLALTDTPDAYTGQEGKTVAVKADATGLEFVVGGGASAALGVEVQRVATQSIALSTNVTISFDTEIRDDAGYFTLSAPTRLTITTTGWYSITAFVQWDSTANGQRILNVRVNGTQYIAVDTVAVAGVDHRQTIAVNWYLAAADYVECVVFQNTAGARTLTALATLVGMTSAPATATTFLALTDTPDAYSGQAGKVVQVNAGATALEFAAALSGTPLSVARYTAAGTALEPAPLTVLSDTKVAFGTTTPESVTRMTITAPLNELPLMVASQTVSVNTQGFGLHLTRRSTGDMIDNFGVLLAFNIADTAGVDHELGRLTFARQGADNSGRFRVRTANAGAIGGHATPGDLAVDPVGNVSLNVDVLLTGGQRMLAVGQGVEPTTAFPADAVLLWSANRGGTAGKNSLHLRTEDGTSHVLGDLSGLGTTLTATLGSGANYQALSVKGSTLYVGQSSVQERALALVQSTFVSSTDATRTGRLTLSAYDATSAREGLRIEADGAAARLSFHGVPAVGRQAVNAAATDATTTQTLVNSVRQALINYGLCV